MNEEDKQRVVSFFRVLMEIDKREKITPTAKELHKKSLEKRKETSNEQAEKQEKHSP